MFHGVKRKPILLNPKKMGNSQCYFLLLKSVLYDLLNQLVLLLAPFRLQPLIALRNQEI